LRFLYISAGHAFEIFRRSSADAQNMVRGSANCECSLPKLFEIVPNLADLEEWEALGYEKQAKRQDDKNTVDAVLDDFLKRYAKNLRSHDEIERTFDVYVRPKIGKKSIYSVTRKDITGLLDAIDDRKDTKGKAKKTKADAPVMADRTLAHLRKAFTWYAARDGRFNSPIIRGMSRTKPAERARKRTLTDDEIRDVWKALETFDEPKVFGTLVKVLLLTAQRRDEIADMRREQIEGDSLVIGADDHKTGDKSGDIVVPLTDAVQKLLGAPQSGKRGSYVISTTDGDAPFSGFSKAKRALDKAIAELRKKDGRPEMPHWVLHDLRRTARSLMPRAGVPDDIAERVLGHKIAGVAGVYNRYAYLDEKRDALTKLARLVDRVINPPAASNVRPLRRQVASAHG
jgi:integrase